jgi:hypothetical protein
MPPSLSPLSVKRKIILSLSYTIGVFFKELEGFLSILFLTEKKMWLRKFQPNRTYLKFSDVCVVPSLLQLFQAQPYRTGK